MNTGLIHPGPPWYKIKAWELLPPTTRGPNPSRFKASTEKPVTLPHTKRCATAESTLHPTPNPLKTTYPTQPPNSPSHPPKGVGAPDLAWSRVIRLVPFTTFGSGPAPTWLPIKRGHIGYGPTSTQTKVTRPLAKVASPRGNYKSSLHPFLTSQVLSRFMAKAPDLLFLGVLFICGTGGI